MHLRTTSDGTLIEQDGRWVALSRVLQAAGNDDAQLALAATDALAFLRADDTVRATAQQLVKAAASDPAVAGDPATADIPFTPRSMRAFMLWESHVIGSGRMLVKNFFPPAAWKVVSSFERVTGRPFPKLKPTQGFYDHPTFYMGNHTMVLPDGAQMWWPSHTKALD